MNETFKKPLPKWAKPVVIAIVLALAGLFAYRGAAMVFGPDPGEPAVCCCPEC